MFAILFLILAITSWYLIYRNTKRYKLVKHAAKIPGDFALPFLGNVIQFLDVKNNIDITNKVQDIIDRHDEHGLVKFWIGQAFGVLVWDPKYVEIIANSPHTATKGEIYRRIFGHTFQGTTVSPGGRHWKELRKPLTLVMTVNNFGQTYLPIINRRVNDFVEFILKNREGQIRDTVGDISALLVDSFIETHIGVQLNEVWDRKWNITPSIDRILNTSIYYIFKFGFFYWQYLIKLTSASTQFEADKKKLTEFLLWILKEREKVILDNNDNEEYYTDFLVKRREEKKLSEQQMLLELADVIAAGSDAIHLVATSAILFLAMFPEVQEEAYREQYDIFGDSERDPSMDDIKNMKYLEMVFNETLRHVGNPGVMKMCTGDITLGKFTIPEGAIVFPYSRKSRKDPKYWERPNEFYPQHFLPEKEAERNKYVFAPFGLGLRMCAGQIYGFHYSMILLSTLLRNFKVTTPLKFEELQYGFNIFFHLKPGYIAKYEKRMKQGHKLH